MRSSLISRASAAANLRIPLARWPASSPRATGSSRRHRVQVGHPAICPQQQCLRSLGYIPARPEDERGTEWKSWSKTIPPCGVRSLSWKPTREISPGQPRRRAGTLRFPALAQSPKLPRRVRPENHRPRPAVPSRSRPPQKHRSSRQPRRRVSLNLMTTTAKLSSRTGNC